MTLTEGCISGGGGELLGVDAVVWDWLGVQIIVCAVVSVFAVFSIVVGIIVSIIIGKLSPSLVDCIICGLQSEEAVAGGQGRS